MTDKNKIDYSIKYGLFNFNRTDRDYWFYRFEGGVTRLQLAIRHGDLCKINTAFINSLSFDDWQGYEEIYAYELGATVKVITMLADIVAARDIHLIPLHILKQFPRDEWVRPHPMDHRYIPLHRALKEGNLPYLVENGVLCLNKKDLLSMCSDGIFVLDHMIRLKQTHLIDKAVLRRIPVDDWLRFLENGSHRRYDNSNYDLIHERFRFALRSDIWQNRAQTLVELWKRVPRYYKNEPRIKRLFTLCITKIMGDSKKRTVINLKP